MNKPALTVAVIAVLAMPASGVASALPRTIGPEPTEAEMRAAVEGKTDAMKEHFQQLERHCRNMRGGSSIEGLRCLFGTFGTQAASNIKVGAFKKIQCRRQPPGWACQYIIHMDMGDLDVLEMNRPTVQVGNFLKTEKGWLFSAY